MNEFLALISNYPASVPTVLVGVLMVFWILAILGALDFDHVGPDWVGGHHDVPGDTHLNSAPELIVALGFNGLPFSIVISAIGFFWWALTLAGCHLPLAWLPLPAWLIQTAILLTAFLVALPLAAICVKPLKKLFAQRGAVATPPKLIGTVCKILTNTVDQRFGQAEVIIDGGTALNIPVWARTPNDLTRGSTALILAFDHALKRYEVESYQPTTRPLG